MFRRFISFLAKSVIADPTFRMSLPTIERPVLSLPLTNVNRGERTFYLKVKSNYVIWEAEAACFFTALFDLSAMRGGDRFEIKLLSPVASDSPVLREHWVLDDAQQPIPVYSVPFIFVPKGSIVTATISRGEDFSIGFSYLAYGVEPCQPSQMR